MCENMSFPIFSFCKKNVKITKQKPKNAKVLKNDAFCS